MKIKPAFRWIGSDDPDNEAGVGMFKFGRADEWVTQEFAHIDDAKAIFKLMERIDENARKETREEAFDRVALMLKEMPL